MGWIYRTVWLSFICVCWASETSSPSDQPALYGEVQSPQYPKPYPGSFYDEWELSVPVGYRVQLTFTHLDIEPSADCFYDSVTVMYGKKVLGKFCGQENSAEGHHPGSQPIVSPGNYLHLIFQSDESNPGSYQHIGFSAFYQAIDVDECSEPVPEGGSEPRCSQICHNTLGSYLCSCRHGYELRPDQHTCVLQCDGGLFREMEGVLSSPGYPQPSPHGLSCRYHISVEPGFTVTLNFTEYFHIEEVKDHDPRCLYHWLQVSIPGRDPQKLCGRASPGVIQTSSHSVELQYHTDWEGLSNGWRLHYTTQRVQCPSPAGIAHGRVTPTFQQYLYRDYIQVRCDTGYKIMMGVREIQGYFSMCQSDAQWNIPLPECHIIDCGDPSPLLNGGVTFVSGSQNQYLSVIQYHCNEPYYSLATRDNVSYTCEADRKWKDHSNDIIPTCFPECGRPTVSLMSRQRVLGGESAPPHSIPWQVFLLVNKERGGAALIGDQWILTAAHNLLKGTIADLPSVNAVKAYVGDIDVENLITRRSLRIASLHPHPDYHNPDGLNYNHDIALIKLNETITFDATVMPLCLPPKDAEYLSHKVGMVSGFGITEKQIISNKLKYIRLPLVDQAKCSTSITTQKKVHDNIPNFTDNMFCAGLPEGGSDTCAGDSGGSFTLQDRGQYWAAGVVSWGVGCGLQGTYGIYTRVGKYIDWIKKTMDEN